MDDVKPIKRPLFAPLFCKDFPEFYAFAKNVLGFRPHHIQIYRVAFTHRSCSVELVQGCRVNNERLEYLGDAVLSSIVASYLYKKYPLKGEGFLTELRSKMVSRKNLNKVAKKMGLNALIRYDSNSSGIFKSKDGDGFEALIGAMYLDRGYEFTKTVVVNRIITLYMDVDELANTEMNYKSRILDMCQREHKKLVFEVDRVMYQGPTSRAQYDVYVNIDGERCDHAIASSIKAAEQLAAEKSYKKIQAAKTESEAVSSIVDDKDSE